MPRVLIVGGGFGGLYAARAFKTAPVDVTVVDRRNHHVFQPLLYQVATMKRKGFFRGALDTGLNATPFLGAAKNAVELIRGRDFIPDRLPVRRIPARPATAPYR